MVAVKYRSQLVALGALPTGRQVDELLRRIDPDWARAALALQPDKTARQKLAEVRDELLILKKLVDAGDTLAVLTAIARCAEKNLPLPAWLAKSFLSTFRSFVNCDGQAMSLDEAFHSKGLPVSTRKRAAAAKLNWQLGQELYMAVCLIGSAHPGLDSAIEAVLSEKKWGVGKSTAKRLLTLVEKQQLLLTGGRVKPLSKLWAKTRKLV